jgi:hypothetical protein
MFPYYNTPYHIIPSPALQDYSLLLYSIHHGHKALPLLCLLAAAIWFLRPAGPSTRLQPPGHITPTRIKGTLIRVQSWTTTENGRSGPTLSHFIS